MSAATGVRNHNEILHATDEMKNVRAFLQTSTGTQPENPDVASTSPSFQEEVMTQSDSILACCGFSLFLLFIAGCGAHSTPPNCPTQPTLGILPLSATADHNLTPPGNTQQFTAELTPAGCAIPLIVRPLTNVVWSLSDNTNAKISNAQDMTYGIATCTGTSTLPVTVTATLPADQNQGTQATATATLVCR